MIDSNTQMYNAIVRHITGGARVFLCGNGGSAAIAQHIAAELMVKFRNVRRPIAALCLSTDTSVLTAHANDFGYETVFSRQLEAWTVAGDIVILMSTSGKSENIKRAALTAWKRGALVIALTGEHGLVFNADDVSDEFHVETFKWTGTTAAIQEGHLEWLHSMCEVIDGHC